jgi:F-type H+-transporting ATPase subunit delta
LLQRSDLGLIREVAAGLEEAVSRAGSGPTEVEVTSAVILSDLQRQALETQLQEQYGQALDVRYRVEPRILGGLIVRIGDRLLDNSVAARMAALRQAIGVREA